MTRPAETDTSFPSRARTPRRLLAIATTTCAALALSAPSAMGQACDQYCPPEEPPPSTGSNNPPPSTPGGSPAPSGPSQATASGGGGGSSSSGDPSASTGSATGTETAPPPATTGAAESPTALPATGFNALPVALLGVGLIVVGALGLRRRATS